MKLLMTGGTGFIGRSFIERFRHHDYTVLSRNASRAKEQLPSNVAVLESLSGLENLNQYDAVINLAGEPIIDKRWSKKQKATITNSRLDTTHQLVDLIRRSQTPPSVFLSGSAIGIYGDRGDELLTESSEVRSSDFPSKLCMDWEGLSNQVAEKTRVVNLRTGIVLDPHKGALSKMLLPYKLNLGGRLGSGKQYMSWIHIEDMLSAMAYLLETSDLSGPINMVAPNPVQNQNFSDCLADSLGRIAVLPAPGFVLKMILGESSILLLGSQRIVPTRLQENGFEFRFPVLNDALENLLINPD